MKTVYVVTFNVPYEGGDIEKVFSTYEAAKNYLQSVQTTTYTLVDNNDDTYTDRHGNFFEIDRYDVDDSTTNNQEK